MLTNDSFQLILFAIPVYQMLFYTIQLISVSPKNPSRIYLGLLMLSMTIFLIANAWIFLEQPVGSFFAHFFFFPLLLSIAPFFYLFVISLVEKNSHPPVSRRFLVYVPALLVFLIQIIVFSFDPITGNQNPILLNVFNFPDLLPNSARLTMMLWLMGLGFLFVQLVFATTHLRPFLSGGMRQALEKIPSLAYFHPRWLTFMAAGVLFFILGGIFMNLLFIHPHPELVAIVNLIFLIGGGVSGHFAMKMDNLFKQVVWLDQMHIDDLFEETAEESAIESKKPSPVMFITPDEAGQLQQNLVAIMHQKKPYCDTSFSLNDLCRLLNSSKRKVTYVINEVMQKNFYAVVNEYRVKESMRILQDPESDKYKMETISGMSGFSSKSTFYACFRKYTGMTPSEYREIIMEEQTVRKTGL